MNYRLFIDVPLTDNQEVSIDISKEIVEFLRTMKINDVNLVQYKLSHDSDRGNKNYLDIDEFGHCSNKKFKIEY